MFCWLRLLVMVIFVNSSRPQISRLYYFNFFLLSGQFFPDFIYILKYFSEISQQKSIYTDSLILSNYFL